MENISEALSLKLVDGFVFGTNAPDYNDGKIKLTQFQKTFYTCSRIDDNSIYVVGVSMITGKVTTSISAIDNVESQFRSGYLDRKAQYIPALRDFNTGLNLLVCILSKYHVRIPQLVFVGRDNISINTIERIFRMGVFRTVMSKYRYKLDQFGVENNQSMLYVLKK